MSSVTKKKNQKDYVKVDFDSLPEIYKELALFFDTTEAKKIPLGMYFPNEDNYSNYDAALEFLKQKLLSIRTEDEKLKYLGFVKIPKGKFSKGTNKPLEDKRLGYLYNESPSRIKEIEYEFYFSTHLIPNFLYEIWQRALMLEKKSKYFQIRTPQSFSALHPAVNIMQGNAVSFSKWFSQLTGLNLRLPIEDEWEYVAYKAGGGNEYIYGQSSPSKGAAYTFDPESYYSMPIHSRSYPVSKEGIKIGGNVWEITLATLERDFHVVNGFSDGECLAVTFYNGKGGGFQHCSQGPRHAQKMGLDPIVRSPSLGFRLVAIPAMNKKGWRASTSSLKSKVMFRNGLVHNSTVQIVQTYKEKTPRFVLNGKSIPITPSNIVPVALPIRATALGLVGESIVLRQTEHLLAALSGLNIWKFVAFVDGSAAIPALDFSAKAFAESIVGAGFETGSETKMVIKANILFEKDGSYLELKPGKQFYKVKIDFPQHELIKTQEASYDPEQDSFIKEVAPARTFIRSVVDKDSWSDISRLALIDIPPFEKISEAPFLVATKDGWNCELNSPNEPAVHKLQDLIGDLALLGAPLIGDVFAFKPGHQFNTWVVKELYNLILQKDERIEIIKQ